MVLALDLESVKEGDKPKDKAQKKWKDDFFSLFVREPGEHCLIYGITGSGKTQNMFWICDLINNYSEDTIVWFDIGKNDEALKVGEVVDKPLKVFVPAGCDIEIDEYDFELFECNWNHLGQDIWKNVEQGKANIISIYPFIPDPKQFTNTISEIFKNLVIMAHRFEIETPMSIFHDEFHNVCPTKDNALDPKQYYAGAWIQHNIEKLRSLDVRFVASSHGTTKIRKGVKSCFNWKIFNRIAEDVGKEQKKMDKYSPLIQKLRKNQCVIVFPWQDFTDPVIAPFYGKTTLRPRYNGLFGDFD